MRFAGAVGAAMAVATLAGTTAASAQGAAYWNDAAQQALEFERSGTTLVFENGYSRGAITPRPAFTNAAGFVCRDFEAAVNGRVTVDTACRGGNGVWFLSRPAYAPPPHVVYRRAPVYGAPPPAVVYVPRPRYNSYYPYAYYPQPYPVTSFRFVFRAGDRDRHHHHHHRGRGRGWH